MSIRCCAAVLSTAVLLSAQTTHFVSGGGAALQLMINIAAPGDILDVQAGTYSAVTVTRGLRITLRSGAQVNAGPPPAAFTVNSLPSSDSFVLEGAGSAMGIQALGCAGTVVCNRVSLMGGGNTRVDNCTGPVVFHRTDNGFTGPFLTPTVVINNSAQVSFTSCSLGRTTMTGSHVTFADTYMQPYGGSGTTPGTQPTLRITLSTVSIDGGSITGGVAASFPFTESGIRLESGNLVVAGPARIQESSFFSPPSMPAIQTIGGTLRVDPAVVLVGTPPINGPAVVTFANTPSIAFARTPGSANYQVALRAEAGSLAFTLINLLSPPLPSPYGDLWINPVSPIIDVTAMPANGVNTFTRSLANVPPFFPLALQAANLSTAGTVAVSPPLRFVWD
jgi:hypothetical protein